jgi:poly-gamma-glutamate synthesis protein (capsule biosynthesis protein)
MIKKAVSIIVILVICLGQVVHGEQQPLETVRISLVGDILLDGTVARYIENNGVDYPWEHVSPIFGASDLVVGNLETSVGTGGQIDVNKQYTFQSKPETLKGMVNAGVDGVSIANNHILDYGQEGFKQTLDHLEAYGIQYAGGGENIGASVQPVVWDVKGTKIGFLAFSRVIYDVNWYATEKRPGILSAYDHYEKDVSETIRQAREKVDFLIVSVHWGKELAQYPEQDEIKLGRMMIDSGADVIMGHHPHVLQGIELYKNKPIIYSLGNFVFSSTSQLGRTSMIYNLEIGSEGIINTYIIPVEINHCRPTPLQGKEGKDVVTMLNAISRQWGTKILESGDIVGNIKYAERGLPHLSDEVPTVDSRENESMSKDKRAEKLEKLSRFLGYDFHYDGGTNIAILMKKNEALSFDYGQEMITIQREKKKILKSLFIYTPLHLMSRFFKWSFRYVSE